MKFDASPIIPKREQIIKKKVEVPRMPPKYKNLLLSDLRAAKLKLTKIPKVAKRAVIRIEGSMWRARLISGPILTPSRKPNNRRRGNLHVLFWSALIKQRRQIIEASPVN
mmetsp:Transcript_17251/g.17185  ORF Transcript_17251/g.17185 Transcript_17251/m.17185 type:complete len:110 (-) Transcript_17251:814-1143(-)